ncbi:MAG: tRNA (guanosine(46)-N7)-methyltransferase TrmB [Saprospiraceae bacterium]|nr:tRNA (guanosine(46)-N7)-methyltransferase TrmB [Saprospiraceae bacterium]
MAGRNKLQKFAEMLDFPNVYENFDNAELTLTGANGAVVDMKGNWHRTHFKNDKPITLELACGRGEYALALGRMFPERNFIGVDIKGARIHQGARVAIEENLPNVVFLRTRIEFIEHFFAQNEVSEIWITFPDPFLRESKSNRRLTSPMFLTKYKQFLKANGLVHLKTDSPVLYDFTLETLQNTEGAELLVSDPDFYAKPLIIKELEVKTYYEKKNIANSTMKYICFKM